MDARSPPTYSINDPAPHALHECREVSEFRRAFAAATGMEAREIADELVAVSSPKAIFLVGSIPLGMATSASDLDFIVLVETRDALLKGGSLLANSQQRLEYRNEGDALLVGEFATLRSGVLVDVQVAVAPVIQQIARRLRRRGPELSDTEVRTLGRLATGWLVWESADYVRHSGIVLNDPALQVYCCTKSFVSALINLRKARHAIKLGEIFLGLQLGRSAVESAYLAYFASEGLPYLGAKWLAQLSAVRAAPRPPCLQVHLPLLFPDCGLDFTGAARYLRQVADCLTALRALIEQRALFRIAFQACPQVVAR